MTTIDTIKYTAHRYPGKFEGETAATEYFYEQFLNGDGEEIYADLDSDDPGPMASLFKIDSDEAEAFGLLIGSWFMLREDSQGFAYGTVHATRDEAEKRFQEWVS